MNSADPIYYEELKLRARHNRNNPTEAESYLWEILRDKKMDGYKFRRQHIIGKYIVDFICLSKSLIVEVDGGYHDSPTNNMMIQSVPLSLKDMVIKS
jgi:5-methyltetrahydrofolate--homocysteine methyltransferase